MYGIMPGSEGKGVLTGFSFCSCNSPHPNHPTPPHPNPTQPNPTQPNPTPCRLERELAAKEASLPPEPPSTLEEAVSLMIRLPDGGRYMRRFRKTDRLQVGVHGWMDAVVEPRSFAFWFTMNSRGCIWDGERALLLTGIDVSRVAQPQRLLQSVFDWIDIQSRDTDIKPGSYNLVMQYPRRLFEDGGSTTLAEADLGQKTEALFVQMKT
jgi:hypothetical protein